MSEVETILNYKGYMPNTENEHTIAAEIARTLSQVAEKAQEMGVEVDWSRMSLTIGADPIYEETLYTRFAIITPDIHVRVRGTRND